MFSSFSKTPVSALKNQKTRRSGYCMSPTRAPLTPNSRNCSFSLSFANSIIEETPSHVIEAYGSTIPVLVTEAVSSADRIADVSVKLESFGWASLVYCRQLFIWEYKQDPAVKTVVHCQKLTLPPSDLAHKAELVHIFQSENSKLPSALAVSPEGLVRYWPNINHEGSSVDAATDLQGQECYSLTSIFPLGCILATTTSTLVLITPTIGEGQPNVICRPFCMPQGVLAGIGRKVSSFIFGVVPTQTSETKQLNRVLAVKGEDNQYFLYVLTCNTFQKWQIAKNNSDQLLYEVDLERHLKQNYIDALFKSDSCLLPNFKTWCLDMQLYQSGVMILTAGLNPISSERQIYYAFGALLTSTETQPQGFCSFSVTKHCDTYREAYEEKLLSYKFILPTPMSLYAYVFSVDKVFCFQVDHSFTNDLDEVDFHGTGNLILGSGTCEGFPLFFTHLFGVVSFIPNQTFENASLLHTSVKEATIREPDPRDPPESLPVKLRLAMCSYCNGHTDKCQEIINEIMPDSIISKKHSELDEAVVSLSIGIIDDYPVSDPRWCESVSGSVSSSLLISFQIDDKLKVHEYLLNFLKAFELLDKLSTSNVGDVSVLTSLILCEHAEKLVAAKALRRLLQDHADIVETAIKDSLNNRNIPIKAHLTPQDVFFREVSAVGNIFPSLIDWEESILQEDENLQKNLNIVMTVNRIFVGILEAVFEYRHTKADVYSLHNAISNADFAPWTSRETPFGIRSFIRKQLTLNINEALKCTEDINIQGAIYKQYVDLLDLYLDGYKSQLMSLKNERQQNLKNAFEKERYQFLKPLLLVGQIERTASLAEKYSDFDILIEVCEETGNQDKLKMYMQQFKDQNFAEYVFKWYIDKGKRGKLFEKTFGQKEALGHFLKGHENLNWIHHIQNNEYNSAHLILKELAFKETNYVDRKKTLLSLSKLNAMVSDGPESIKKDQVEAINFEQNLIAHQESLPVSTVESYGLDPRNMRVLKPDELIEMYISDDNASISAYDFKIALDLLRFIRRLQGDPDLENLRLHIWCKAILRNNWEELDVNNPLDAIKDTIFFQVIELAFDQGVEMHDFIPKVDDLLQSQALSDLSENPNFQFLLRVGYEHILKIID